MIMKSKEYEISNDLFGVISPNDVPVMADMLQLKESQ